MLTNTPPSPPGPSPATIDVVKSTTASASPTPSVAEKSPAPSLPSRSGKASPSFPPISAGSSASSLLAGEGAGASGRSLVGTSSLPSFTSASPIFPGHVVASAATAAAKNTRTPRGAASPRRGSTSSPAHGPTPNAKSLPKQDLEAPSVPELAVKDMALSESLFKAFCERDWVKVSDLIHNKRVSYEYRDSRDNTILHAAVEHVAPSQFFEALLKVMDPNLPNRNGATPLHFAAAFRVPFVIAEMLLLAGGDPNRYDVLGFTPLMICVEKGAPVKVLDSFIKRGGDANLANYQGFTALHIAAEHDPPIPVIRSLLQGGADVNRRTLRGSTPLDIAYTHGASQPVLLFLADEGAYRANDLNCCIIM